MYNFIILSIYKTTNYGKLLTLKNVPSTTLASFYFYNKVLKIFGQFRHIVTSCNRPSCIAASFLPSRQ